MLPGPVFFYELRSAARRRRAYLLRALLGLFLLYLILQSTERYATFAYRGDRNQEYTAGELAQIGLSLWTSVISVQAIVILLLTPTFVAATIAEDRQRKVLVYLLASPLSGAEIVLGKLAARLVNLVVLVAVGLPVVSLALFLGGIDPNAVWLGYATSFSTLYLVAGLSILVSTFSERPRDAILRAYLLELIWLFLPLLEQLCVLSGGDLGRLTVQARPITEWIIASSPAILLLQTARFAGAASSEFAGLVAHRAAVGLWNADACLVNAPAATARARGTAVGFQVVEPGTFSDAFPPLRPPAMRRCPHDLERMQRNPVQPESLAGDELDLHDRCGRAWPGIPGLSPGPARVPGSS